uniref:Putative receptor-like protein kinase At5g39020 n=1 Tax=Rhizophora mucronata TaxID=61149 RepID=A0A2P2MVT9_RHIMU
MGDPPNVSVEEFRCYVSHGPSGGSERQNAIISWIQFSKPEIRNLGQEILIEQYVMRLDIKMQDLHIATAMQIFNALSHTEGNLIQHFPA